MGHRKEYVGEPRDLAFHWCGMLASHQPWRHDYRVNPDYELFIGVKNVLYLTVENEVVAVKPGDMLLIPPQTVFYGHQDSVELSFYWFHFQVSGLILQGKEEQQKRVPNCWRLPFYQQGLLLDTEIGLLQQMQLIKESDFPDHTLLKYYGMALLQSISDKYHRLQAGSKASHYLVDYIKMFIQDNYRKPLTVGQIANYFGYNKAYLSHLFSQEVKLTLTQYIMSIRLEAARQELLTTTKTLKEIAYQCGFSDEKYFSRVFASKYQRAPREYRKKYGPINKM